MKFKLEEEDRKNKFLLNKSQDEISKVKVESVKCLKL